MTDSSGAESIIRMVKLTTLISHQRRINSLLYGCLIVDKLKYKWEMIVWGFTVFSNAIYFRLTLEDNIDRLSFFEELSAGYIEMTDEYLMSQPGFDPWNLSGRDPFYFYVMCRE